MTLFDPAAGSVTPRTAGRAGDSRDSTKGSILGRLKRPVARLLLQRFSKRWRYDVGYMEEMLATTPDGFFQFLRAGGAANYRRRAPLATWGAVRLVTMRSCDCGPCLKLTVDQLLDDGLAPAEIRAVLDDRPAAMRLETALGYELALALVERGRLENSDADRREADRANERLAAARLAVERAEGRDVLIECALTFALVQSYPLLKRGMGYDRSCSLVEVRVGDPSRATT